MEAVTILSIENAPDDLGGGLYINEDIYVDQVYDINISWKDRSIVVLPPDRINTYVGDITTLDVNGHTNPTTLAQFIEWLAVPESHGFTKEKIKRYK